MKCNNRLKSTINNIAENYAMLVEERIDATEKLTGKDLKDIHNGIQTLKSIMVIVESCTHIDREYFCNYCNNDNCIYSYHHASNKNDTDDYDDEYQVDDDNAIDDVPF